MLTWAKSYHVLHRHFLIDQVCRKLHFYDPLNTIVGLLSVTTYVSSEHLLYFFHSLGYALFDIFLYLPQHLVVLLEMYTN